LGILVRGGAPGDGDRLAAAENRPLTSLRALAAIWVFVAHLSVNFYTILPRPLGIGMVCGWLGVDVFFVLSGFILASVYAELAPPGWPAFLGRRALRVFPLNLALLGVLSALALAGLPTGVPIDWPTLPWHLLMLQSFVPGHKMGWLFVTWSVGIELICYLAFPLLMLATRRLRLAAVAALLAVAALVSFRAQLSVLDDFWGWGAILRGGSGFSLGAALGVLAARMPRLAPAPATALELLGAGTIVYGAMGGFNTEWCMAVGSLRMASVPIGAAILILGLAADTGPLARLLRGRVPFHLGRISFSIYLIHWPLMLATVPLVWTWGTPTPGRLRLAIYSALLLLAVIALASLTYRFVELPARRLGRGRAARRAKAGGGNALAVGD
jgi:peptidoglycan/LPS O-acetylase OafA/YrhL